MSASENSFDSSLQNWHANWNYPTAVRVGVGRVCGRDGNGGELAEACAEFNIRAPLLVTDPGLAKLPMVEEMHTACAAHGLKVAVFSEIKANPNGENVAAGVAAFQRGKHDGVIAVGGGSGLDVGKTIAVLARQNPRECKLWDLEDIGDNWRCADAARITPSIAIPTTAGTGSEVGRAALIVDSEAQRKVIIFHPQMLPACVFLDAELSVGLPANLTAATGMDALSHNLEAYCSPLFHPMAEGIAVEGMRLIQTHLARAVEHGGDRRARLGMLVASTMGATAFQRGLGAMHALAHPLGALYDAHHGMLNAILMPYVLRANREVIAERIARLAHCLELGETFDDFLDWVLRLRAQLAIPNDLAQIGIADLTEARAAQIGEMAVADPSAATNPIAFTAQQYAELVRQAMLGDL